MKTNLERIGYLLERQNVCRTKYFYAWFLIAEIKLTQFLKQASALIKEKKTYVWVCLFFFQEHTRRFESQSFSYFSYLPTVHDENKWHIYARKERIKLLLKHLVRIVRNIHLGRPLSIWRVSAWVITYKISGSVPLWTGCIQLLITFTKQNGRMK